MANTKTPTDPAGRLERQVKMDYSATYKENEKLDLGLDDRLCRLKRTVRRTLSEKDEELNMARADANKILKLKEAVNSSKDNDPKALTVLCQSAGPRRRKSSEVSSSARTRRQSSSKDNDPQALTVLCQSAGPRRRKSSEASSSARTRRQSSAGPSTFSRTTSVVSSCWESMEEEEGGGEGRGEEVCMISDYSAPEAVFKTPAERRLAKQRERFSAKNLFNARRKSSSALVTDSKRGGDVTPDTSRPPTPTAPQPSIPPHPTTPSSSSPPNPPTRPKTSPPTRSTAKPRAGYLRPTTSSVSRTVRFAGEDNHDDDDDGFGRRPRRPRSRRELQKLVELKIDPFEEEPQQPESWSSAAERHRDLLLHSLQAGRVHLEARVSAFLQAVDEFNVARSRGSRSGVKVVEIA